MATFRSRKLPHPAGLGQRYAADVVEVGFGNGGTVDFAAEHGTEHGFPF